MRARTAGHFADIDRLQRAVLPGDEPHPTDTGVWWLVYDGDKAVAFAGMVPSKRWALTMYLCRAGVAESHRGQGLQKRLIGVRERAAKALGVRWLITDTTANPASSNSLIARGFRLYEPSAPWGPKAALYWRKKLEGNA